MSASTARLPRACCVVVVIVSVRIHHISHMYVLVHIARDAGFKFTSYGSYMHADGCYIQAHMNDHQTSSLHWVVLRKTRV